MTGEFWQTWGDGQAEVASYDLTMPKDGQLRKGTAVAITAAEPFSKSLRVKADEGKHAKSDVASAMKLNLIRGYQTGVSSHHDMVSAFIWLEPVDGRPEGMPSKVTFSSQEWCGHVWSQLIFGSGNTRQVRHSYFDGEADVQRNISGDPNSITEDGLLLVARRIAWPRLTLGQAYSVPVLTSLETERAQHVPLTWERVQLKLSKDRQTTIVPAGRFRTNLFEAIWPNKSTKRVEVEADPPFRVIRWTTTAGEKAELLGATRMKYWQMNAEGDEKALETIGLRPRGPRTS